MIIVKGGKYLDLIGQTFQERELVINGSYIETIANPGLRYDSDDIQVIDASGCWIVPGLVDIGTHLREPGFEWKEDIQSGLAAASAGGFTSIACLADTNPVNDNAEISKFIQEQAKKTNKCSVYPLGSLSKDLLGQQLSPYTELFKAGCCGFSDVPNVIQSSSFLRRAFEWCTMHDAPIITSPSDCTLTQGGVMHEGLISERIGLKGIPESAETICLLRDLEIAKQTGGKLHIFNVSSKRSVELIRRAKLENIAVTAGVTPNHLLFSHENLETFDTSFKVLPPLREDSDRLALIEGVNDGTIDVICSNHEPHEIDLKRVEFGHAAYGAIGLQTLVSSLIKLIDMDKLDLFKAFASLTINPANLLNIQSGGVSVSSQANFAIIDPEKKWTFNNHTNFSKSKNSPVFECEMIGKVKQTFFNGKLVYEDSDNGSK